MIGVIVNSITVILGSILGLAFGNKLNDDNRNIVSNSAGVVTLILGIQMALTTQNPVVILLAMITGGLTGHLLGIEKTILNLGERIRKITGSKDGEGFAHGFLSAVVLFCVGAMTIIGSFRSGTSGDNSLIFLKSTLDGFMAIILASTLGIGVLFSSIVILLYQGILVLSAGWLQPYIDERLLTEIGAVGGLLVLFIGLDLLKIKKVSTADFLPSLLFVVVFVRLETLIQGWFPA